MWEAVSPTKPMKLSGRIYRVHKVSGHLSQQTTPVPFIVGAPRSGTTLVRAMLDSHPDLAIPFESHFVPRLLSAANSFGDHGELSIARFCEALQGEPRFRAWGLPISTVRTHLESIAPASMPDLVRGVFDSWARSQGKKRWGDKTPKYALHVDLLARAFPESVFIHVIRDGRNVAASYLATDIGPKSIMGAATMWSMHVDAARKSGATLATRRYREVLYEHLIEDPEFVLRDLCRCLQLEYSPSMLDYHERVEELVAGAENPEAHWRIGQRLQAGARDFEKELTTAEIRVFEGRVRPLLEDLGYASANSPSVADAWHRLRHSARKFLRSVRRVPL